MGRRNPLISRDVIGHLVGGKCYIYIYIWSYRMGKLSVIYLYELIYCLYFVLYTIPICSNIIQAVKPITLRGFDPTCCWPGHVFVAICFSGVNCKVVSSRQCNLQGWESWSCYTTLLNMLNSSALSFICIYMYIIIYCTDCACFVFDEGSALSALSFHVTHLFSVFVWLVSQVFERGW